MAGLRISLRNNQFIYKPGDTIHGQVQWYHSSPQPYSIIELKIIGRARVEWSYGRSYVRNEQTYLSETVILTGLQNEEERNETNHQIYPFTYKLPRRGLAPVFEGNLGYISYHLEARSKPKGLSFCGIGTRGESCCKLDFLLYEPFPLPHTSSSIEPHVVEGVTSDCLCLSSGKVSLALQLPGREIRGEYLYSPGTPLPIRVIVLNDSRRMLKPPFIYLKQRIVYYGDAEGLTKTEEDEIAVRRIGKCLGNGERKNESDKTRIPPRDVGDEDLAWVWDTHLNIPRDLPQSYPTMNSTSTSIITVEYFIKVSLSLPMAFGSESLKQKIAILIGAGRQHY